MGMVKGAIVFTIVLFSLILKLEIKSIDNIGVVYRSSEINEKEWVNSRETHKNIIKPINLKEIKLLSEGKTVNKFGKYKTIVRDAKIIIKGLGLDIYSSKFILNKFKIKNENI